MSYIDETFPLKSLPELIADNQRKVDEFGFLGDATTPVEVEDWNKTSKIIQYAIRHAHTDGKCVKSRFGFCK